VSSHASQEVIQAAYHVLARTWHPDVNKNPDAPRRIREINGAYEVLSDGQRRATYELQRARLRRRERVRATADRPPAPAAGGVVRGRGSDVSARSAVHVATRERLPLLSGPALLALAVVAALMVATVLLVWVGLVLTDETPIGDPGLVVDIGPPASIGPPAPMIIPNR
jgi:hypothetical protein